MKIDNFDLIGKLIDKPSYFGYIYNHDAFFHIQVMLRKKEHPEIGSNSRIVKHFYVVPTIKGKTLNDYKNEIIDYCDKLQARAYINLNPKSLNALMKETMCVMALRNKTEDVLGLEGVVSSCAGSLGAIRKSERAWIVDVDGNQDKMIEVREFLKKMDCDLIIPVPIKTPNGYHLITEPFDKLLFKKYYPEIDIHTNNPTLLYCNL